MESLGTPVNVPDRDPIPTTPEQYEARWATDQQATFAFVPRYTIPAADAVIGGHNESERTRGQSPIPPDLVAATVEDEDAIN